jgi:hypothetical protein
MRSKIPANIFFMVVIPFLFQNDGWAADFGPPGKKQARQRLALPD